MDIFKTLDQAGQNFAKGADEFGQGLAKGADEFGQGLAKGADEAGQQGADTFENVRKGADEAGQGLLQAAEGLGRESAQGAIAGGAELGSQVTQRAQDAAAEIRGFVEKAGVNNNITELRAAVLSGCGRFCSPDDVGCAHALRCWLETAIAAGEEGVVVGGFKAVLDAVGGAVRGFADEHPVLCGVVVTLLALAVMALLVPPCISALGFGAAGPVAGSWAAGWQSALANVEAGSIFAFFQSLGMTM
ncbi:hypothetical protein SLS62_010029 [Diatrype stigma]|uniref:Uncharacterized protein n=1 Tax=Diatrype stigma TaxID=117547 RepID=A0AAN9UD89_9PEZI